MKEIILIAIFIVYAVFIEVENYFLKKSLNEFRLFPEEKGRKK